MMCWGADWVSLPSLWVPRQIGPSPPFLLNLPDLAVDGVGDQFADHGPQVPSFPQSLPLGPLGGRLVEKSAEVGE